MSVITDYVRAHDLVLERFPLRPYYKPPDIEAAAAQEALEVLSTPRVTELLEIVKSLSTTSSQPLLTSRRIESLILKSGLATVDDLRPSPLPQTEYESDIEWLLVSKAAIQVHGLVLRSLLEQIIPLRNHTWYWDEILGSYAYSSLYTFQTSPMRFWDWSKDIYRDTNRRLRRLYEPPQELTEGQETGEGEGEGERPLVPSPLPQRPLSERWLQLYKLVMESIAERSTVDLQRRVMSPVALCRSQAMTNLSVLKGTREKAASGLGVLLGEGFRFNSAEPEFVEDTESEDGDEWKGVIETTVTLVNMVLKEVTTPEGTVTEFEDRVIAAADEDPELLMHVEQQTANPDRTAMLARRLLRILRTQLPQHLQATQEIVNQHGRPSKLVRLWLPAGVLVLSSTTLLRILMNRREDIINWIADFGATVRDFWTNWVVEPSRKVIGTIRHDTNSEIAIMSRDSLKADQDSLERMVVEFARDKPSTATGQPTISEAQLAEIQLKVREGDVTPVLKAYEHDLRKPFVGAVRGDLVRSLLIQVQKTKVDLEVAMSGIDALLKSQELVFGFIGLTPGFLVSVGMWRYLRGVMGGRKGLTRSRRAEQSVRVLRNIDKIFSEAKPAPNQGNVLPFKDLGLLICEIHVLRQLGHGLFPGDIEKEFLEDIADMAHLKEIPFQLRALERIRWAYAKWLR